MSDKLKIGITCYPTMGGSGVVATELGKLLAEKGHDVHFIAHSIPFRLGKLNKRLHYHEVDVQDYYVFRYPPYDLTLASKLAQVARSENLDLLHVHYAIPHAVCALLAKQMTGNQLKIVTTLHGTDITVLAHNESMADLIRYAINESDAVTAVSQDLIRETREMLLVDRPIDLTYNFVDKRVYQPRDVQKLRREFAPSDEKILLHISNLRPVKRVLDVIEVFNKVNSRVPSRLVLVGEGPDLPKAVERIQQLNLTDRVHLQGKQEDVVEMISLADLHLLTSEKESFGLVALEAMACGVPTIGSLAGGIPELVQDGVNGYLSPVGDTDKMAEDAIRLLSDAQLYQTMRQACLHRAESVFSHESITAIYEDIYYRTLGRGFTEQNAQGKKMSCLG